MRLLIVAGGGGHFAAALAVIQKLPKDWEYLVIGRKYTFENDSTLSFEYQTARRLGIPFQSITTGRLQRKLTGRSFVSLLKIPVGLLQALRIMKSFRPEVILSFGGYVALPICYAAWFCHIPIVIHEQILGAGLTNKLVAKCAKKICVSWEQSAKFFPKEKVVLTGNPTRTGVIASETKQSFAAFQNRQGIVSSSSIPHNEGRKILYVTGGSGGAHAINILVEESLDKLLEEFVIIHQTGDAQEFHDYDRLATYREQFPDEKKKRYLIKKFFDPEEVSVLLREADLVVSRSGINTVTELLYFRKPCLLIPLPYGQRNEQLTNANFLKELGLAHVADQKTLTSDVFLHIIKNMMHHRDRYTISREVVQKYIKPNAAEAIVEVVADVYQKEKTAKA